MCYLHLPEFWRLNSVNSNAEFETSLKRRLNLIVQNILFENYEKRKWKSKKQDQCSRRVIAGHDKLISGISKVIHFYINLDLFIYL